MFDDIEVLRWTKATYSNGTGACVEVAAAEGDEIAVRNSRDPEGAHLRFTKQEWAAFLAGAKAGEFDSIA